MDGSEKHFPGSDRPYAVSRKPFDASTSWSVASYRPEISRLIAEADIIQGIRFAKLEEAPLLGRTRP